MCTNLIKDKWEGAETWPIYHIVDNLGWINGDHGITGLIQVVLGIKFNNFHLYFLFP